MSKRVIRLLCMTVVMALMLTFIACSQTSEKQPSVTTTAASTTRCHTTTKAKLQRPQVQLQLLRKKILLPSFMKYPGSAVSVPIMSKVHTMN